VIINDIADGISRQIEAAHDGVNELLFEPVIRLGVTGLSRAGKTVFITSLISNLRDRGRMPGLQAAADGRILSAYLQPQPDDDIARFPIEDHLADLRSDNPSWPQSTRTISQLRLSMRVQPGGMLSSLRGPTTVHLDIVDYPGEWLLDLPLLDQSFEQWSKDALAAARSKARTEFSGEWLAGAQAADSAGRLDETIATRLTQNFTDYLQTCRNAGLSACAPGRFLMPGDLAGSPALTFAPLTKPDKARSGSLWRAFERRFESYKRIVVKPFFRNHFSRIDRQIVLIDVLGAIHAGPRAVEDLRDAMADIMTAFRPGQNSWLSSILGKRTEKILFAATKADHLHQSQHGALQGITDALLREARDRADHAGADTRALAIAAWRATVEENITHDGEVLKAVRGRLLDTGQPATMYPGELPNDPRALLASASGGAAEWLDQDYAVMRFAPQRMNMKPGEGPPHIRLDSAAEFLIGDRLR